MVNFTAADRVGGIGGYIGGIATLLGLAGNVTGVNGSSTQYVTKDELNYVQELGNKDSEIALLKAESDSEKKMIDIYKQIKSEMNVLEGLVRSNKDEQTAVNTAQQVYNATNSSTVAVINNQVAQLMALTALKIPKASICPEPMDRYNSWTAPSTTTG